MNMQTFVAAFSLLVSLLCHSTLFSEEITLPDLIAKVESSIVRIEVKQFGGESRGSGFVIEGGWIVTNYHVVDGATSAKAVFLNNDEEQVLGIRAYDAEKDLAILEIEKGKQHLSLPLSESLPRKGDSVVAFGAPMGFSFTPSQGIVSGIRGGAEIKDILDEYDFATDMTWVQTTAPISPGNSGGPLVGMSGNVVGVNSWTYARGQNLNFAVSTRDLLSLTKDLKQKPLLALGEQSNSTKQHGADKSVAQRNYYVYAQGKFNAALQWRRQQLKFHANNLHQEYRSNSATYQSIAAAKEKYEASLAEVKHLRTFHPGTPRFLRDDSALFGTSGEWYILQIISPDSMLVKISESDDSVFCLRGVPTIGKVDDRSYMFDGIWSTQGETHSYHTAAGSSRTVYVIRPFPMEIIDEVLEEFRRSHVEPAVDAALASAIEPSKPEGEELARIKAFRAEKERIQLQLAKEKERIQLQLAKEQEEQRLEELKPALEKEASMRLTLAKRFQTSKPYVYKRRLREIIAELPTTQAAGEAEELLNGKDKNRFRTWHGGKHSTRAVLLGVKDESAVLKRMDGRIVTVPLSKLSEPDRQYVEEEMRKRE